MAAVSELFGESLVFYVLRSGGDVVRLFGSDGIVDEAALKRAYKSLALRLHPDKNPHSRADEAFQVMQRCFETTLEALRLTTQSRGKTPPPSPPHKEKLRPEVSVSLSSSSSFSFSRQTGAATHSSPSSFNKPIFFQNSYKQRQQQKQRSSSFSGSVFSEVPLPLDVFDGHPAPNTFASCGATETHSTAKSLPKRTLPLPTLDIEECCSDGEHDSEGLHCEHLRRDTEKARVAAAEKLSFRRKGAQEQKLDASRRSLLQLFAQFDISDVEDETAPVCMNFSSKKAGNKFVFFDEQNEKKQSKSTKTGSTTALDMSAATMACPYCGAGKFLLGVKSGVVCPACRWRFVPAVVGMMMTADSRTTTGREKKKASGDELCACGKAKKGLCFLCD